MLASNPGPLAARPSYRALPFVAGRARVLAHTGAGGMFNPPSPAVILAGVTWGRRFRASREGARARALLATETVCVLAWALTGEALALLVALFAAAAVVVLVLDSGDRPPRQRRVR